MEDVKKPKVSPLAAVSKDPAQNLIVPSRRSAYMGKDSLCYAENEAGYVYLTTPQSPIGRGFQRKWAETASDMEKIWAKLDLQEKNFHERQTESIYNRNQEWLQENRAKLHQKLATSDNEFEKDCIREWIEATNNLSHRMQKRSIYGVAAMQESEAAIAPTSNKKVVIN